MLLILFIRLSVMSVTSYSSSLWNG